MRGFDTVAVVDWSARSVPSPARPSKDAIFVGLCRDGAVATLYQRTRAQTMRSLRGLLDGELRAGRRVLLAFDFPFAYPNGFARAVTGEDDPLSLWAYLSRAVEDDERNGNNRFAVASGLNARFGADGPFWGHPQGAEVPGVPFRKPAYAPFSFPERRTIERLIPRSKPCFQLMGAGSVGSQALLGIARLQDLRDHYGEVLSVAPFEAPDTQVVLAECYPGLFARMIEARARAGEIPDRAQVRVLAWALGRLPGHRLDALLREGDPVEGWILGHGATDEIAAALP
ncbi:molybdopterin guanine dinucleotide synthesis [Roseibacterium sp. SDUM158016]|uniref:molybdopterin guanine dinucleotide synthesis n=1 Tax=Roseicyclus sediminis TaxID=2980997 RepID=UPI0021CFEA6E|nr:molybdopterin guanine dinucleotide synthesis [Roseibacterium sp. SDUM158016]MCU4652523.1 molybdopterin guanine dinucleotide synthesis [Roseibacterium sp. SDUM158016]